MSRKIAAGLLIVCEDRYLCLLREKGTTQHGTWAIPGGKVDASETEKDAAIRETEEETGVRFEESEVRFVETIEHDFDEADKVRYTVFSVFSENQFKPALNPKEHSAHKWATLPELVEADDTIDTLTDIIERFEDSKESNRGV